MPLWKKMDSPNVTHCSYGIGDGQGGILSHMENSVFEDAPYKIKDSNTFSFFDNALWRIIFASASFRLDYNNDSWDIFSSY